MAMDGRESSQHRQNRRRDSDSDSEDSEERRERPGLARAGGTQEQPCDSESLQAAARAGHCNGECGGPASVRTMTVRLSVTVTVTARRRYRRLSKGSNRRCPVMMVARLPAFNVRVKLAHKDDVRAQSRNCTLI